MIERILPSQVTAAESFGDDPAAELFPQERLVIARATESRRKEFATARACARAALARLGELTAAMPGTCWDRLLFSAKESVYKTWFPLARSWLGFESANVVIDPRGGTFTAHLLVRGPLVNGAPLTLLRGRWLADQGLLLTAAVIPAE